MLMEVKNNIKFILLSLKYNLKACAEYKKSFILQSIFMFVNNFFFLIFWNVVFNVNGGEIKGIVMNDIYLIWAFSTISWGIANVLFGGLREINTYILNGELDSYLLQPKNILLSIGASKSEFSSFGDLIYGLFLAVMVSKNIFTFLLILLYSVLGAIITCACIIGIRTLAIWIGDVERIARIYEQNLLITFGTYPYEIFGKVVKALMYTIIPAVYIAHIPAKLIVNFELEKFVLLVIFTFMSYFISSAFFKISLKKYESGNNIAMKE